MEHQCFLYYWRHANANRTVNYRCIEGKTNKKCSASCVVNEKGDHIRSTPHNHPSYTQLEIEIRSFATNVKENEEFRYWIKRIFAPSMNKYQDQIMKMLMWMIL